MAKVPSKHGRDQDADFQGFLNDLQDWELSIKDKDKKMKAQVSEREKVSSSQRYGIVGEKKRQSGKTPGADYLSNNGGQDDYLRNYKSAGPLSSSFLTEETAPDATSEKELGNDYFKQKKFKEAIDCYSRSIALSPSAVAYANRAMAYLKIRRFQEAEDDCTEALNLDDRYIKAYSRRATARKELGKLKESLEDAEFALKLEPNNQEIKKQFAEAKSLLGNAILQKVSGSLKSPSESKQEAGKSDTGMKIQETGSVSNSTQRTGAAAVRESIKEENGGQMPFKTGSTLEEVRSIRKEAGSLLRGQETSGSINSNLGHMKKNYGTKKQELKASVQELGSRAASLAMIEASENITPPNTAYQFEASWRAFSGNRALQARLLKAISPAMLPQIFKSALTAPILIDIVKCTATFFTEDMELAVNLLENLTKVPRFDMLIMCLSSTDKSDLRKLWDEVFCNASTPIESAEMLDNLRSKYCLKR